MTDELKKRFEELEARHAREVALLNEQVEKLRREVAELRATVEKPFWSR